MSRLEFPRKVRRTIIERAAGRCEQCQAVLKPSEGEVDHVLPAAIGGAPVASNARLLCRVCHKAKTAIDVAGIRKADRQRDRHSGAIHTPQRAKIPTPPKPPKPTRERLPALPPVNRFYKVI